MFPDRSPAAQAALTVPDLLNTLFLAAPSSSFSSTLPLDVDHTRRCYFRTIAGLLQLERDSLPNDGWMDSAIKLDQTPLIGRFDD